MTSKLEELAKHHDDEASTYYPGDEMHARHTAFAQTIREATGVFTPGVMAALEEAIGLSVAVDGAYSARRTKTLRAFYEAARALTEGA